MVLTLLTDYGRDDDFVGVCHAVIRSIVPDIPIVDITHGISRFDIRQGALVLRNTLPFMPVGVHVAVVDPQVGTARRAVALRTHDRRLLVGPDNGLLSLMWDLAGGIELAVDVTHSPYRLDPVSATFHGRDVFAPVAAQLAAGVDPIDAGERLDPSSLTRLELPEPRLDGDTLVGHALAVDRFGNVALDVGHGVLDASGLRLGATVELDIRGERYLATYVSTFADVRAGELIVYEDAYRTLAIAINRGDAWSTLGLAVDTEVRLRPR